VTRSGPEPRSGGLRRRWRRNAAGAWALAGLTAGGGLAACGSGAAGPGVGAWATALVSPPCREAGPVSVLPDVVRESSGVVVAGSASGEPGSERAPQPTSFWTHNDSGWPAEIFRVGTDGALMDRVGISGAVNVDWEDMAAGPCPERAGSGHRCLYLADTGDNAERRASLDIYRVREPGPGATLSAPAHRLRFRLPHGPRDIEALVLLDDEGFLLVTKGRNHPVEVYLLDPADGGEDGWFSGDAAGSVEPGVIEPPVVEPPVIEARRVQALTSRPPGWRGLVTGAAAAPLEEGGWIVALRTYQSLRFFRVASPREAETGNGPLLPIPGAEMSLLHLREPQGEAVAFAGGGSIVLTSEGGLAGGPASIRRLDCAAGFVGWGVTPLPR